MKDKVNMNNIDSCNILYCWEICGELNLIFYLQLKSANIIVTIRVVTMIILIGLGK